jgi:hypothetical protein
MSKPFFTKKMRKQKDLTKSTMSFFSTTFYRVFGFFFCMAGNGDSNGRSAYSQPPPDTSRKSTTAVGWLVASLNPPATAI